MNVAKTGMKVQTRKDQRIEDSTQMYPRKSQRYIAIADFETKSSMMSTTAAVTIITVLTGILELSFCVLRRDFPLSFFSFFLISDSLSSPPSSSHPLVHLASSAKAASGCSLASRFLR